jgi:Uma2 family endonuclease
MATPSRKRATIDDLIARADYDRLEIIAGAIVEKASPSPNHSLAEIKLGVAVDPFNRRPSDRGPGGWWIFTEIHTHYPGGELYCHDAAGWRRDRVTTRPTEWPVHIRPDWVCEIVSPKHEKQDLVDKPRVLHAAEVPHYWVLDPDERILLVHRWSRDGYTVVQRGAAGETVRAEPFDAIELEVGVLFGDDESDG